jgi:hypothetical protein
MSEESFLSEPIDVDPGTADVRAMARGEPGLPTGFRWRGRHYQIAGVIETWKSNADAGEGKGYLRRHWYKVLATSGEVFTLYCLRRTTGRKHQWWVYSVTSR